MNQAEYARASGLTRGRVSQLVADGMPLNSKAAADRWRGMSARPRPGRHGKASRPAPAPEADDLEPGPFRPAEAEGGPDLDRLEEDGPHGAYERQREMERAAYRLARESLRERRPDAGRMVAIHAQAAANLAAARERVLALAEKERGLVSGEWVRKVMLDHDGAVATLIKAMPKQLAGRISPHDPDHAEKELDRWVQEVCLATLHSTDPWRAPHAPAGLPEG